MGFFVIKGTYHVTGYSPDGDSLRFMATDPAHWNMLGGPPHLAINSRNHVQLRLEGIDTLESHYSVPGGMVHQPLNYADSATEFVLDQVNITGVVWNANLTRIVQANDGTPGYILARKKDQNGRPICFAFAGLTAEADGSDIFFSVSMLPASINYRSLAAGHAYPTYYTGLFADLRDELTAAVTAARANGIGVFGADKSQVGFAVTSLAAITDEHVMLPKLFRRLAEFIAGDTTPDLSGFLAWLDARNEQIFMLRTQNFTHFDNIIEVIGQTVRLTELPEQVVFSE